MCLCQGYVEALYVSIGKVDENVYLYRLRGGRYDDTERFVCC